MGDFIVVCKIVDFFADLWPKNKIFLSQGINNVKPHLFAIFLDFFVNFFRSVYVVYNIKISHAVKYKTFGEKWEKPCIYRSLWLKFFEIFVNSPLNSQIIRELFVNFFRVIFVVYCAKISHVVKYKTFCRK